MDTQHSQNRPSVATNQDPFMTLSLVHRARRTRGTIQPPANDPSLRLRPCPTRRMTLTAHLPENGSVLRERIPDIPCIQNVRMAGVLKCQDRQSWNMDTIRLTDEGGQILHRGQAEAGLELVGAAAEGEAPTGVVGRLGGIILHTLIHQLPAIMVSALQWAYPLRCNQS